MGMKKRMATFVSNWLGVIIAAVIVLVSASFGGMYLYGRSRLDSAINFVTQAIHLRYQDGLTQTGTIEDPPGYTYHLILQAYNYYADTIDTQVSDITILLDTYSLTVVEDGAWTKSLPTGYATFEGNFTIDAKTFEALVEKGKVDVHIEGTISGKGQYQWVKRQSEVTFNISISGVIFELNTPAEPVTAN